MKLYELLKPEHILLDLTAQNREEVIAGLVELLAKSGAIVELESITKLVIEREREVGTGIGYGVAIPHSEPGPFSQPCAAFVRLGQGVDFQSPDGNPARLIFLLLTPDSTPALHVRLLARICRLLKSGTLRESLLNVASAADAYNTILAAEADYPELCQ